MHDPLSDFPPSSDPTSARRFDPRVLEEGFVSDDVLAGLIARGLVAIDGSIASTRDGKRYALEGAVRVLGLISRETDPFGYIGRIEPLRALIQRGFVMSAARIALGRICYAVEYGAVCQPIAGFDQSGVRRVP